MEQMPLYAYKARDASGKVLTGRLEGKAPSAVADLLGKKAYFP